MICALILQPVLHHEAIRAEGGTKKSMAENYDKLTEKGVCKESN